MPLIFGLLLSLQWVLAVSVQSQSTPIQRADTPRDAPIKIVTSDKYTLCYIPTFSLGAEHGSYIGILSCSVGDAIPARYDVFGRIGFEIEETWLCITAPDSVAISGRDKDYLYLSPCAINLKSQQWRLVNGSFYSNDQSYSIKDDGSYLYAAHKLNKDLRVHSLHTSMKDWQNTIAIPGNLSLAMWIGWGLCTDRKASRDNRAYFKPVPISETAFAFEDKDRNVLRVTRYGSHWGVLYAVNKKYLPKDTGNSPTSAFVVSDLMHEWLRYVDGNIGKNLHYCPASGSKEGLASQVPPLPTGFSLNREWIDRFYATNRSADGVRSASGVCGVCLLQAYQVLAEILNDPTRPPTRGYFFDTAVGTNPFLSFRARNALLHDTLADILDYYNYPLTQRRDAFFLNVDRAFASSISMLPQYNWHRLGVTTSESGIRTLIENVISQPSGSTFLLMLARYDVQMRRLNGHAVAALRLQNGVVVIPANSPYISLEEFEDRLRPANTTTEVIERLTSYGPRHLQLVGLGVFELDRAYSNSFETIASFGDCDGDGRDRRGNALLPIPELLNQCISGRCEW